MAYRFGLIGEHIATSLSPVMFSWAFQHTESSGSYTLFDFPRRLARSFLLRARVDWDGLNVTAPHKDLAYTLCDELSETAQRARAVNTLVRKQGTLIGYNTDVAGFRFALEQRLELVSHAEKVLVIGTGGAARAALVAISQLLTPNEIAVASRRPADALERITHVLSAPFAPTLITHAKARKRLHEFDIIVQATPVGHLSNPGFPLDPPFAFKPGALVFDLIYSPRRTLFLETATSFGAIPENGLVMLLAQAAESYQIWTGKPFPLELAVRELLPELRNS
ncbi:MAG: shikimate dehydrogenase [Calditrichaeota bacterium]|nr:shikimate dehydrogenase [Calditrichota bacterium]MCB9368857.1 shikimate dehydrogenase [Calditrichota bacterium]